MPRILLTGATGFIGSHVVRCLLKHNCDVAVVIRPQSNLWRISDVLPHLQVIRGDLTDVSEIADKIRAFAPDVAIHLAWYGVGNRYRNDPHQVTNLQVGLSLLDAVHAAGCRSWIGLGSQAEYGVYSHAVSEEMPTHPVTLYGVTKLCTCLLTQRLCDLYNIRFVWLRLFSAYGPADDVGWMIPYVILTLLRGERPALTAGEQRWDYLFVEDAAEAIYRVAVTPNVQGIFNLGSGKAHTVRSIVERIRNLIDPNLPLGFGEIPYRPDQIMHLQADITKLQDATGWSPRVGLDEGLRRTVDWYRKNRECYV
jgi:UDP-glucose 4-epimerase